MPKHYFKAILVEWILSNAEKNSMFYMKDIFLSDIDTQVRIDKGNLAYDILDDYVNTKTQRFFKNFGQKLEDEILEFKGEIRGQWEKTLVQKDLIIQQKNALIRSLFRAQSKNPQLSAAKKYFAHILNLIYSKAENLGKHIFRSKKGKLIGLANCLLKFIDKWKEKYKHEFENLKILENEETMNELTAYHLICQIPKYDKLFKKMKKPLQFKLISSIVTNLTEETNYQEQENLMLARMEKIYDKKDTFMTIQSEEELFDKIFENNDYLCGFTTEISEELENDSLGDQENERYDDDIWKPPDLDKESKIVKNQN